MERVKNWWLPVYVTIGFLCVICLMPQTRWIMLQAEDVVSGLWHYKGGMVDESFNPDWVWPIQRGIDDHYPANDETARFLRDLSPSYDSNAPVKIVGQKSKSELDDYEERFVRLFGICQAKGDARYWAQFVRMASNQAMVAFTADTRLPISIVKVRELLGQACEEGERLDPDNAFFWVIDAGVKTRENRSAEAAERFGRVANCRRYNAYASLEPELRYRYLVDHYGYRGEQLHAMLITWTLFPHVAVVQNICRLHTRATDPKACATTAHLASMMMSQSNNRIEVIVGRNLFNIAMVPQRKAAIYHPITDAELELGLTRIQKSQIGLREAASDAALYRHVNKRVQTPDPSFAFDVPIINLEPAFATWPFLALLLLPLGLGFLRLKTVSERFASASPFLVWLLADLADPVFGSWASVGTGFGVLALVFLYGLSPKFQRYADIIGVSGALIALIASVNVLPLAIPAVLLIGSLLIQRRIANVPAWVTSSFLVAACLAASACWIVMACKIDGPSGAFYGLLACVGCFAVVPAKAPFNWPKVAGASCVAIGLLLATTTYRQISIDRQISVIIRQLSEGGDDLRR